MQQIQYVCVKCGCRSYDSDQFQATGGDFAKLFNVQNKKFVTISCRQCGYTELYRGQTGTGMNVLDGPIGDRHMTGGLIRLISSNNHHTHRQRRLTSHMQFVHAVLSLHIAQNSQISQTSQTVRSGFDQFVLWYGNLPQLAQTVITVVVGAIVAYLVFKIVAHLVKGLVTAVIAAILAFLISTVPGNLLLSSAFDRIQQEVTTHLPSGIKDQLG